MANLSWMIPTNGEIPLGEGPVHRAMGGPSGRSGGVPAMLWRTCHPPEDVFALHLPGFP